MNKYSFFELLKLADKLLGPNGCPWDKKQTLDSLQPFLIEEMHELLEAVDNKDFNHIAEETGDLLYQVIFISKIAEIQGYFTINDVIDLISDKIVRRHPHIFSSEKLETAEDVYDRWNEIKKEEKKRTSSYVGVPKTLPSLMRGEKLLKKYAKIKPSLLENIEKQTEEKLANQLYDLLLSSIASKVDIEGALRRLLDKKEKQFWQEEKNHAEDNSTT